MTQKTHARRFVLALQLATLSLVGIAPQAASAQGIFKRLKDRVERSVESEVLNKVEDSTRTATRCALGDNACTDREQAQAGDANATTMAQPTGDHPLISAYQGSVQESRDDQDFTDYPRIIGMDKQRHAVTQTLEGKLTKLVYQNPKGRSTLELIRNYENALKTKGFQTDYSVPSAKGWITNIRAVNGMIAYSDDVRYFTGKLHYNEGTAYVSILVYREGSGFGRTNIHILETKDMDAGMVGVDPSAMAAQLDQSGEVNLQGVFFDTGKFTLKPESNAELDTIAALMQSRPDLRMDVVGHTDSAGNASANMLLSMQRATAVRDALVNRGIAADRLRPLGMGSTQPIATNTTEAGRAQNRRVMLMKR